MDQYKTWLAGLKRALLYQDDLTLHSTINIAPTILNGIPEGIRGSTFVGQPGLLERLSNLQKALRSEQNAYELKTALSDQIQRWEETKFISTPTLVSPPSQSSYGYAEAEAVDLATRQTRVCPVYRSDTRGHYQGVSDESQKVLQILAPANSPSATLRSKPITSENCSRAPCLKCVPFPNKINDRDSSENYNADRHNRMGQEDGRLTQTFTDQELLAARYRELVGSLQEREEAWTRKLAQDTQWMNAVDRKLQIILDLLDRSQRIGPSNNVPGDNLRSYFGPDGGMRAS